MAELPNSKMFERGVVDAADRLTMSSRDTVRDHLEGNLEMVFCTGRTEEPWCITFDVIDTYAISVRGIVAAETRDRFIFPRCIYIYHGNGEWKPFQQGYQRCNWIGA